MLFKLEVDTGNAALCGEDGEEVDVTALAEVLRGVADRVEHEGWRSMPVRDANGNRVGWASFVDGSADLRGRSRRVAAVVVIIVVIFAAWLYVRLMKRSARGWARLGTAVKRSARAREATRRRKAPGKR